MTKLSRRATGAPKKRLLTQGKQPIQAPLLWQRICRVTQSAPAGSRLSWARNRQRRRALSAPFPCRRKFRQNRYTLQSVVPVFGLLMLYELLRSSVSQWATTQAAIGELPDHVANLAIASCPDITHIAIPGGKSVSWRGPDGRIECDRGNAFVPAGISHWELSTRKNPREKAEADFKERLKSIPIEQRLGQTFVFATPHAWPSADEWRNGKQQMKQWKDVKTISIDQLVGWLSLAPWVAASFNWGGAAEGLRSLDQIWREYAIGGKLDGDFVIADRTNCADSIMQWLQGDSDPKVLRIYGKSYKEICRFLAASVARMSSPRREMYFQRTVGLEHEKAARWLPGMNSECVVVVSEGDAVPHCTGIANRGGCRMIICCVRDAPQFFPAGPSFDLVRLIPPAPGSLVTQVMRHDYPPAEAARLCEVCAFDYVKIRNEMFCC